VGCGSDRTRRAFQRNGVPDYSVVDGDAHVFEVWRPGDERPEIADDRLICCRSVRPWLSRSMFESSLRPLPTGQK
jgi:hypothetical protein